MYIYMLEIEVYDGDSEIKDVKPWNKESKLFTKSRYIDDVKRYAKYFISEAINDLETDNPKGSFIITTQLLTNKKPKSIFDKILKKYGNYKQYFSLDGEEMYAQFTMCHINHSFLSGTLSMYFDSGYIPKYKPGDIVHFTDSCDSGEYVVVSSPKPILTTNENKLQVFYSIKGYANQRDCFVHYDTTDHVLDSQLRLIPDNEVKDSRIFIIRDFVLGKRTDIENIDDEYLKWVIEYKGV